MVMNEIPGGFWRVVSEGFIQAQLNKPFFGRPYLKLGQCFGLWGYMLELGGILGAKHAAKTDAFVSAFLGMSGAPGLAKGVLVEQASGMAQGHSLASMKFWDYVAVVVAYPGYTGVGYDTLVSEQGTQKVPPNLALTNSWEFASAGAALGTTYPDVLRAMFERTHARIPEEKWAFWHAAGLDIGSKQTRSSYKEAEDTENKDFMDYCQKVRPDLYSLLRD